MPAHPQISPSLNSVAFAIYVATRHTQPVPADANNKNSFLALLSRHAAALVYVVRVVLPVIFRTGRRPVIFSRFTGMGDIICTIPAARELKQRHPGATFIYNCHRDFIAVPQIAGLTGRVTSFEAIGLVGHWYRFLLGGFYHFAHGDDMPGNAAQEPMVVEFFRQFNLPVSEAHPELRASPAAQAKVKALLARKNLEAGALVLLHPGPSWKVKEWPHEHWAQLVVELRRRGFTNIAQLGVARYLTFGQVAIQSIPGTVSLVDELSVEECIAAIGMARLFIGIDSGLLHIAAGTRTPAVGIWGPTNPRLFYSEKHRPNFLTSHLPCSGCEHLKPRGHWFTGCPHDINCMKSIGPAEVLMRSLAILEAPVED